jgi:hypothetical protein
MDGKFMNSWFNKLEDNYGDDKTSYDLAKL